MYLFIYIYICIYINKVVYGHIYILYLFALLPSICIHMNTHTRMDTCVVCV